MISQKIYFKHMGSCLPDQPFDIEIDEEKKVVHVALKAFDTSLFTSFIERVKSEHGIRVYADDNEGWMPKRPEWQVFVMVGKVRYRTEIAKLMDITRCCEFGVVLIPDGDQQ